MNFALKAAAIAGVLATMAAPAFAVTSEDLNRAELSRLAAAAAQPAPVPPPHIYTAAPLPFYPLMYPFYPYPYTQANVAPYPYFPISPLGVLPGYPVGGYYWENGAWHWYSPAKS